MVLFIAPNGEPAYSSPPRRACVNPMRYFLVIVRGLFLQGEPAERVAGRLWLLVLVAAASPTAARWLLRDRLAR